MGGLWSVQAERPSRLQSYKTIFCHSFKSIVFNATDQNKKASFGLIHLQPTCTKAGVPATGMVLDQLNEGEMPPEERDTANRDRAEPLHHLLESGLKQAAAKRSSTGGRQLMRRMSRYEYQYTLEDLLGVRLDYTAHIPGDLSGEDGLMTNAKHLGMYTCS